MAITRAQQVKQMLREGGRIEFRRGGIDRGFSAPSSAGQSPRGSNPRSGPPTRSGGSGSRNVSPSNLSARERQMGLEGKTGKKDKSLDVGGSGKDDRGNVLQNRNQQNIVSYARNLAEINANKDLSTLQKFNAKKRLRNKQFIDRKFTEKAQGIADAYGLTVEQVADLLDKYDRDLDKFDLSTFRGIVDAGAPPSIRSTDPDFLKAEMLDYSKRMSKIDPTTGKRIPLSTAELFDMTDPTSRIELPSPLLNKLQGDPSFSNVLSGLNRLKTLDEISKTPGGVKQSDIDNYFNLTMGKGGIDPITKKPVEALFPTRDDDGPSDPCLGPNPPAYCFIGQRAETPPEDPIFTPSFRFMNRGGMVEDAPMGGIMDLESTRQMLFLGGIADAAKKAVKKVTRGLKKVAKSPLGKAAILGTIGYGLGGGFGAGGFKLGNLPGASFFGKGSLNPLLRKTIGGDFAQSAFGSMFNNMTGLKVGALSGLGGALLASLENKDDDDFDIEEYYKMAGIDIPENQYRFLAEGGDVEPVAKKTMPLLDMDGQEMDFRQEGGFVPIGRMEKADDVPARLSKNEFVFTADAVRNAGGGDVDKGAEVMYNTMKNLEAGGEVSEETQGLEGAKQMFQTSQRLGEVV